MATIFGKRAHFEAKWLDAQSRLASSYQPSTVDPRQNSPSSQARIAHSKAQPCRRLRYPQQGHVRYRTFSPLSAYEVIRYDVEPSYQRRVEIIESLSEEMARRASIGWIIVFRRTFGSLQSHSIMLAPPAERPCVRT